MIVKRRLSKPKLSTLLKRNLTILLVVAAYSLCYIGIKSALPYIPPLFFAALRILSGGVALLVLLSLGRSPILPDRSNWRWIGILALVSSALGSAIMFYAADMTSVGIASVLGNLQPMLTVLLALIFLHESVTLSKAGILLVGTFGIVLISLPSLRSSQGGESAGALLAFASSLIVATTSIIVKRHFAREELLRMLTWQLLIGAAVLFGASLVVESWSGVEFNSTLIWVLIALGVVGTGLVNYAWYTAIGWGEVGKVSMYFLLVPVIGFFSGVVFHKESFQLIQLIGAASIIIAMIFLTRMKLAPDKTKKRALAIRNSGNQGIG